MTQERLAYVLSRLQEDGVISSEQAGKGLPALPTLIAYEKKPRRDIGFHFVDHVEREARTMAGLEAITANSYTVRSTINPQLQRAVERTLQEGLSSYERGAGRVYVQGARSQPRRRHRAHRGRAQAGRQNAVLAAGAAERAAAAL